MKCLSLSVLIITILSLATSVTAQQAGKILDVLVDIVAEEQSVAEVLKEIEEQANCEFSYSSNLLPTSPINCRYQKTALRVVLTYLLRESELSFFARNRRIIIYPKKEREDQFDPNKTHTLSGYLRDADTGEDLIGGTIYFPQLEVGGFTNAYGFYSITIPEGEHEVQFGYVGYQNNSTTIRLTANQQLIQELAVIENKLTEVVVTGTRKLVNVTGASTHNRLNVNQIKGMPALFGEADVIRNLKNLPGVLNMGDGSGGFSVRGGSNDHNLVLLDEAPVYHPSHLLGIFSIFNPDAIKDARLMKGNIPTEYRGRLGSVLDIHMQEGSTKKFGLAGGMGLLMGRLKAEGQLFDGKSSFMVAGRRTYLDWLFAPFVGGLDINLFFYDLNSKVNVQLGPKDRLYFSAYNGRDVLRGSEDFSIIWGNNTFTTRWNHLFSDRLFSNTSLIISDFDYRSSTDIGDLFELEGTAEDPLAPFVQGKGLQLRTKVNNIHLKSHFQFYQNPKLAIKYGGGIIRHEFLPGRLENADPDENPIENSTTKRLNAWEIDGFGAVNWIFNDYWRLDAGLHLSSLNVLGNDAYFYKYDEATGTATDSTFYEKGKSVVTYFGFEPRLTITRLLDDYNKIYLTYNRTVQYLQLLPSAFVNNPASAWLPSSQNIRPQRADQVNLGYEYQWWDQQFRLTAEAYYIRRRNQIAYRDGANLENSEQLESQLVFGKSWTYGTEWMLEKTNGQWTGSVSYAYSRARESFDFIQNGATFKSTYDRPHTVSLVAIWQKNERFSVSFNWNYASGKVVTAPIGKYQINGQIANLYGQRNNYRMSDHHRADVSFRWHKKKASGFKRTWIVTVYNIYFRNNPEFLYINPDTNEASEVALFGFIPAISYNFKF